MCVGSEYQLTVGRRRLAFAIGCHTYVMGILGTEFCPALLRVSPSRQACLEGKMRDEESRPILVFFIFSSAKGVVRPIFDAVSTDFVSIRSSLLSTP